ncbi:MAG: ABC transporter ATP-binding protein [Deltaproteobacteria bacterium]|jgi:iron complex transport system ATP-binding protein|nr:ABC transporter ATP-binding protein [Deltaproteobacteria bacterium]
MTATVDIRNVNFAYEHQSVLRAVSISVQKGFFFIIIGPNGSGKTTLIKLIAGALPAASGSINILGNPIQSYRRKSLAKHVAVVPQMVALDFPFTVAEFVSMGRSPHLGLLGFTTEADAEIIERAMRFTGTDQLAGRTMHQLSGGERQRVLIARAICQEPQIILLDEPTASLDPAHQVQVMGLMEKFKEEQDVTVIMVSHDLNLASLYGDQLLLLKQGEVVKHGSPLDVLTYENLEQAYGCAMLVDRNPLGDYPRVTIVPQKFLEHV